MEKITTSFGSDVTLENDLLIFSDENKITQAISFNEIKNAEDNICTDSLSGIEKRKKIFDTIIIVTLAFTSLFSIYKFINHFVYVRITVSVN